MKKFLSILALSSIFLLMSCTTEDVAQRTVEVPENVTYTLSYKTGPLANYVSIMADNTTLHSDGYVFEESVYNNATFSLDYTTEINPINIRSEFYIESGTPVQIYLTNNKGETIDVKFINQKYYTYKYKFTN